nr:DUF1707 domain-containing protein [Auraticoccus cholistanensis]
MLGATPTAAGPGAAEPPLRPAPLRASDQDRAKVTAVLSTAFAEGRLTHEEHEERLDLAMRARTFDELIPLTEDLVPLDRPLPATGTGERSGPVVDRSTSSATPDRFLAVFGGFERKGRWRVRRQNQLLIAFGGGELDLTEAVLEGDQIEIAGLTVFGGLDVTVPEGVAVRDETVAIFGGTSVKVPAPPPGAPTVVVKGLCLFGGIDIKTPSRKKLQKAARKAEQRRHGCGH